ncbi:sigma 54-interacting transcriptional regulator [Viridibacillus sp. FSL E2-0187]|uniref:sigma 54-interacting transcriptional regulator n=1 Tax=Viridibacillus TaxID=496496 RepID=UPI00187B7E6D|nr:sigma 54-interacting transcriptional regulator [Viridibacillus sp. JNUCC-6]QOV13123.1 sigma 54-interacting transcriptional regulator [Viridibacillus sp. JNUCC-6]
MKPIDNDLTPFYRHATEHASVGIHAVNAQGQTIIYNDKMKEIEGLNLKDVIDRSILELFQFEQEESTLLQVLQTGEKVLNVKQTYWNHNGQEITTINDTFPVFENDALIGAIEFARDITTLEKLVYQPLRRYGEPITFSSITAVSLPMKVVIQTAEKAAIARLPVLLIGESGTGKDLIAEGIHHNLDPVNQHFITIFCQRSDTAILEKLYESTNSLQNCTIFCERIEFLSLTLQEKLLQLLEENHMKNHMFIASIGGDPIDLIASGQLLKELYYFFASVTINVPPLHSRREDIKPFIENFLKRHRQRFGSNIQDLSSEVHELFHLYDWPGNLKELEILLEEIVSMVTTEELITFEMLPLHFKWKVQALRDSSHDASYFVVQNTKELLPLDEYLREAEEYYLQKALNMYEGNITKTANALGMSRQNLQYRIRKMKK